ncbi:MAG: cryptochrome/photolyase family protein [Bacteroidetes bacterium]|nr:cryptochrome/photolyase family protein [Bacteroidota bacterium]
MTHNTVFLVFPHQLFEDTGLLMQADTVYLTEEFLFFRQYPFHKQKLVLHRAGMKYYAAFLKDSGIKMEYIESTDIRSDIRNLLDELGKSGIREIRHYDVCDYWLEKRIAEKCREYGIQRTEYESPMFINSKEDLKPFFENKNRYFQTDFYIQQRKKLRLLLDEKGKPIGGKWSFDAENRQRYPAEKKPPSVVFPEKSDLYREAVEFVERNFPDNYGTLPPDIVYPHTHAQSRSWLMQFLENRFSDFGVYEDAISGEESFLNHSVLTPMLNTGLLTPMQVVNAALKVADENKIPLNSQEGFIRQITGWREFIRGVYLYKGVQERTQNFWNFHKPLSASFYNGTTGIEPVDQSIKKLLRTSYNHHIERLMVIGNFMLLCEYHPDAVYRWFMEMYIDAYDWVMVPNVYGMSQFADGGIMSTKPYISGSSYILKMSHFKKGRWCEIWDALFWQFMHTHRDFFLSNPRLGMLIKTYDKMSEEKKKNMARTANDFKL